LAMIRHGYDMDMAMIRQRYGIEKVRMRNL